MSDLFLFAICIQYMYFSERLHKAAQLNGVANMSLPVTFALDCLSKYTRDCMTPKGLNHNS